MTHWAGIEPRNIDLRRTVLFLFASALLGAGGYLLFVSLEHPNIYSLLRAGGIAVVLIGLGSYLVWDDFIRPRIS
jgi:hypothetical protein